jgi:hypothetical protein
MNAAAALWLLAKWSLQVVSARLELDVSSSHCKRISGILAALGVLPAVVDTKVSLNAALQV